MRHLPRLLLAIILTVAALNFSGVAASASADGAAFSLRPVRYDPNLPATKAYFIHTMAAGQQLQDDVLVRNSGTAAGTVRLYAVDGTTGSNSGTVFLGDADPQQDVAAWITLGEHELTLGPGEERAVPFTITIPAAVAAGQHLGGLVAEAVTPPQAAQSGIIQIKTRNRTIAAVQVNLPGPVVERLSVTGITSGGTQGEQTILLGLRNDGSEMVKPVGTLVVTDARGQEVQRRALKLDTFVPRTAIQYPVAIQQQALGAGQYHAKVDFTYGNGGTTAYEGMFSVTTAQIAQVFPSAAPLAPPPAANAAPEATSASWSIRQLWGGVAGGVLLLAIVANLLLFWRQRATRRRS